MKRNARSWVVAGLLAVATMGCSDSGTETSRRRFSTTGRWSGVTTGATLTVTLNESSGNITGNGTISGATSIALTIIGTNANNAVALTLRAPGFADLNFTGDITSSSTMRGSLNGSGFNNSSATLTKQ